jgi:hypothetical protein
MRSFQAAKSRHRLIRGVERLDGLEYHRAPSAPPRPSFTPCLERLEERIALAPVPPQPAVIVIRLPDGRIIIIVRNVPDTGGRAVQTGPAWTSRWRRLPRPDRGRWRARR